ncbi:MAG: hypothetical protein ACXAC7_15485 [Candidatus Hodarchaeales archaeon]|jgi:hypothetical protein
MSYSEHKALKQAIIVIASHFSNYLSEIVIQRQGLKPSPESIVVNTVNLISTFGRGRQIHLVEVYFNSDVGLGHSARLFIKVFKNPSKMADEAQGANLLYDLLQNDPCVKTPRLLYYASEHSILVYEGLYAEELSHFQQISENEKDFLAGVALQGIHYTIPPVLKEIHLQRYYLLLEKTFNQLIQLNEEKSLNISDQLLKTRELMILEIESRMFYSHGGARAFGDFHAGNLMFSMSHRRFRNTNQPSDFVQIYVIDPEFIEPEAYHIDRFEDIGSFFTESALDEFAKGNTNLELTRSKTHLFLNGYNSVFMQITNGVTLQECYPKGSTLNFHISMSILFDLLFYIRTISPELLFQGIDVRLKLIEALLVKRTLDI